VNRHFQGPVLDMSEHYRQTRPVRPQALIALDRKTWVTHYEGMGALCKRKGSGTFWAVGPQMNHPPKRPR
jgi:hypothetical protein